MRRMISMILLVASMGTGCATGSSDGAVSDGPKYRYLTGTGPYQGRVIDSKTKEPISGVIVVAVWYYDLIGIGHSAKKFHVAIEVVTDTQGYFVVDAPNIERRAPAMIDFPVFTFFKPGYSYYEGWITDEEDIVQRRNKPLLGTVELESVSHLSKTEQLRKLPSGDTPRGDVPSEKVPLFSKAWWTRYDTLAR